MKVMAVDDEKLLLEEFVDQLHTIEEIEEVQSFTNEDSAISYVKEHSVDVAMLDVEMPGMGGILLADKLSEIQPDINIIFVTGYDQYGLDAMKIHASGYLLKSPTNEEILKELHNLRHPIKKKKETKGIYIHTFGNFDVYVEGKPVSFSRQRSKELLAYLVHINGETATRKQLASILFEDQKYDRNIQQRLQQILVELKKTLEQYEIREVLMQGNNSFSVNKELFECDLYDFLENKKQTQFHGYYMENYTWAEEMTGVLARIDQRR